MIDEILMLINQYGFSHVCGNQIFQNLETKDPWMGTAFNFPYLDTFLSFDRSTWTQSLELYFRGYNPDNQEMRSKMKTFNVSDPKVTFSWEIWSHEKIPLPEIFKPIDF